jgi:hypothetical protein
MDNHCIAVLFLPEYRIVADIHIGSCNDLGIISKELVPGLFRHISGVLQADYPLDLVQVRDGLVILVLGADKGKQQQDHRQAKRESPDGNDREKLIPFQGP